jgi:hypothetical protein
MSLLTKTSLCFVAFLFAAIILCEYSGTVMSNTSAAPSGKTGSPGDGGNCTNSCHAGTAATVAGLITSDIPAGGYVPGQTYTITASVAMAGKVKFGFEISAQDLSGTGLGTLIITDATKTQLVGSGKYITHKSAGTSFTSGTATWSFDWTAPSAGTGAVTFYGAFNITNNSSTTAGDIIQLSSLPVQEDLSAGINDFSSLSPWRIFPNPASDKLFLENEEGNTPANAEIIDINGRVVQAFEKGAFENRALDISMLRSGVYILRITTEEGTTSNKFIKN